MIWWESNSYGGLYIIMKTFLLKNDKNRIYFRNYERISAEEELKKLQNILKEKILLSEESTKHHWEAVKDIWVKEENMADNISIDGIAYIVGRIVERAREAVKESKDDKKDSFKDGRALAYYEVLDILRTELSVREISLEEIGLDFDLEKELL